MGEDPFLSVTASSTSYSDTQNKQTSLMIRNGVIQNMFEKHGATLKSVASPTSGLFVNSNGPTILKVHNLSLTNVIFTSIEPFLFRFFTWIDLSLVAFTPATNQFANSWKVLPSMDLQNITMKYTRNVNFLLFSADTVNISNVYLEGLSTKDVTITYAVFRVNVGHSMNVYNLTANNVTGPLFQINDVLAHNFSQLSFNNMYTSQKQDTNQQYIISLAKVKDLVKKGLDPNRPRDSFFDNLNLNVRETLKVYPPLKFLTRDIQALME